MRPGLPTIVLIIVGVLGLAACGSEVADGRAASDAGGAGSDAGSVGKPDTAARLDFTVSTVDGGTFEGASLMDKPAVLWFWAPWCPTCAAQAGFVADLAETYDGVVNVIGVAGLGETPAMEEFVSAGGVEDLTHLADEDGDVWKRFGVTAQSTFVLLNDSGEVVYQGYLEADQLNERADALAG